MKTIEEVTCCIVDSGSFLPLAYRMAEQAAQTIYVNPAAYRAYPSVKVECVGDGFKGIKWMREFWDVLDEIDLFVFPDVQLSGLQNYLRNIGKAVWGSGRGDKLELDRLSLMRLLEQFGLDVPPYEVANGWTELGSILASAEDKYIKISRYRGDMETKHWRSWDEDSQWYYNLAIKFGPLKEHIQFLVFDSIETDLEIGADTYNIIGQWPDLMLNGIEAKDKSYMAAVTKREDMPQQIQDILIPLGPVLRDYGYANQISFEDRVQGDKHYWGDATQRGGLPSSASQQLLWENLPDIIWHGANGILIQPKPAAKFAVECMIKSTCHKDLWDEVIVPDELLPWARFSGCCYVDGKFCFPPDESHEGELGWLCAIGDTPQETLDAIKGLAKMLPDGLSANVEALAEVIKEIDSAKEEGIPFTEKPMPEPATVIDS